jgi:hypothetical protein
VKLRAGDIIVVDRMIVKCRSGKCELYIYGDGDIVTPEIARREGPFDTREKIDALWRIAVDQKDLQADGGLRRDDLSDSGE